jgi:uncharacterized lipoprotein YmbA
MRRVFLLFVVALTVTACAGLPGSDPTRFYVLKTTEGLSAELGSLDPNINVGVGPIQIPGYVDRAQIITFDSGARITVADFDHWAEPVGDGVKRILSANLASIIGESKVFPYPADFRPNEQSIQIAVEITDVFQDEEGTARLAVRWHIKRLYDNQVASRNAKTYSAQSLAGDYSSYADTLSDLLGQFAEDLARDLATVQFQ